MTCGFLFRELTVAKYKLVVVVLLLRDRCGAGAGRVGRLIVSWCH